MKNAIIDAAYKKADSLAKQLVERAMGGSDQAMKELLERTMGKVKEDMTIKATIEHTLPVTPDRFNEIIQVRAKRIEQPVPHET